MHVQYLQRAPQLDILPARQFNCCVGSADTDANVWLTVCAYPVCAKEFQEINGGQISNGLNALHPPCTLAHTFHFHMGLVLIASCEIEEKYNAENNETQEADEQNRDEDNQGNLPRLQSSLIYGQRNGAKLKG